MRLRGVLFLAILLISACSPGAQQPPLVAGGEQQGSVQPATRTPFQPLAAEPSGGAAPTLALPAPAPTPTAMPPTPTLGAAAQLPVWVDPLLPAAFRASLSLPAELAALPGESSAESGVLRLEAGGSRLVSRWIYALVAPFPTQVENVSAETLQNAWSGAGQSPWGSLPLLLDPGTQRMLSAAWGAPAEGAVRILASDELLSEAWKRSPAWAIIPFEALEPRWMVLKVEGQSPLQPTFDLSTYPLTLPVSLTGDEQLAEAIYALYGPQSAAPLAQAANWRSDHLTTLAMTGVTALVRATAFTMERQGNQYPARDIGPLLNSAGLTHISNEIPFARNCPFPDPVQAGLRFCSDPGYIALLEAVGTDIVELTGDHFQDWGEEAMLLTLDLYRERNWAYYGGGENLEDGRKAFLVEHNGNRLAFIGCNAKGGGYAQAAANHPGAVKCDFDYLTKEIARLRSEGYLPIATFQHFEYYTYKAQPDQVKDFRALAEAGAVIVSGSQAHQPQAMAFEGSAFVHYGLGNLFFDQYDISLATRQGFIDWHVFYEGRYISTELVPILFVDYARPRFMNGDEKQQLYNAVFSASGW
ncbi:MAG TPA: CapA family protein [Anaerolineales bacterium]|nr:CapA family protein [Anaerolineales bacterium]